MNRLSEAIAGTLANVNKRILVIVLVLVVLIGGSAAFLVANRMASPEPVPEASQGVEEPEPSAEPSGEPSADTGVAAGSYVEYSDTAIAQAEGRVLLFFHAPWCPQCRSIESDIEAQGVPDGVTIIKVDYDSRQDLRQQYGVTLQTTFVEVDGNGDSVQTFVAYDDPHLDAVIAEMI